MAAPSVDQTESAPMPDGQWVYTEQYGWVFMPYAQNYTYVPASGYPFMFVYYPRFGWHWLSAPWVYGAGPRPYWGGQGYTHFAWYTRPWFARRAYAHPVAPRPHAFAPRAHAFVHVHRR